jgi:glycosyltransferase involved in cell wall biosynthesis
VAFVGDLAERKGIALLLAAWSSIEEREPDARLTVIGKGDLESVVRNVADQHASIEMLVDPPRHEIHRTLAAAAVLVLLSQRTVTWREQVGLPILEGLAHGCQVVTTSETGIADWLQDHGHDVVGPLASAGDVADVVLTALRRRRSAASALGDLPARDGRLAADDWLSSGEPRDGTPVFGAAPWGGRQGAVGRKSRP